MIEIKKVSKKYKDQRILKQISLTIPDCETLAVIGPSGCGKSTLLKTINGLVTPDAGSIFIDKTEITKCNNKNMRDIYQKVGIVFQQFNLFPHMTVKQNITIAPLKVKKVSKVEAEITAMKLLDKVGLLKKMDRYPQELSGGEAQRVAIARSLAMKPSIMLFDEPTSALDPKMTKEVLDVIKELKSSNMTMVIISHEMGFVKEIADRIIFLYNGNIIEEGTPFEVFDTPKHEYTREFLQNIL